MLRFTKNFFLALFVCIGLTSCSEPAKFTANIPKEPEPTKETNNNTKGEPAVIIRLTKEGDIFFNKTEKVATINDLKPLADRLMRYWREKENTPYIAADKTPKGQRTVFLICDKTHPYAEITKVTDILKQAGADPIGLQLE